MISHWKNAKVSAVRYFYTFTRVTKMKTKPNHMQSLPNNKECWEDEEQLEFSHIACGKAKCYSPSKNRRVSYILTMTPSNPTPSYLPEWIKKSCSLKKLHTTVESSLLLIAIKLVTTQMSFSRWMEKPMVIIYIMELLLGNKD